MTTLPTTVTLAEVDARALRELNDKIKGVQGWVSAVSQQGERRMAELTQDGRVIWQKLAATHNLDLAKVSYDLSEDGTKLVPMLVKL